MKRPITLAAALGVLLAGLSAAVAQEAQQEPSFPERLEAWLPGMGAEKIPDRQQSQQALQEALFQLGTPGREAELAEACKAVAGKIGPQTAKPARVWMLRQLEFNGGAECVDAVAACLKDQDAEIRDCARRALQNNPAPEANARLLAALASAVDDTQRLAIANALGYRGDASSVPALSGLLGHANEAVAAAAANALGKIGGADAAKALAAAMPKAPDTLKAGIADACLRCADKFLRDGQKSEATAIYNKLNTSEAPRPIRLAAVQGLLNAAGDEAAAKVLRMLSSDDADQQAVAAAHIENIVGSRVMQTSAEQFPNVSPSGQMLLLAALAVVGGKEAMPVALAALKSPNEEVRVAGLRALAKLGDVKAVPVLIEALAVGGPAGDAAGESLRQVFGEGVDEAIVAAMQKAETGLRGTLIDILNDRRATKAVAALLKEAEHEDGEIRSLAVQALGNVAEAGDVAAMIAILLKTEKGQLRDETEKAVMFVCNRVPEADNRADPVLAVVARSSEQDRCALLPLLGRIGGTKALAEVQKAIGADNAEVQEAGVRALCNWPDASVAEELLKLAQAAENESHRVWALRAYVRVVTLPSERPHEKTLALLKRAMEMAQRDDEKRLVVSRAPSAQHVETLRWLIPYLDDPTVSAQACRAIVELARRRELMGPNQAEFRKALEKVISTTKDQGLIEQAKRYMSGL